jgi:adenylate kinase family enzyme
MKKITVIGCAGSGKTVFSTQLASALSIPLYTIDSLYYSSNWQKLSQEELKAKLIDIMKGDTWIIDGQYTKLIPLRLQYLDTVIFFDIPKRIAIWRIFKRYFQQKFGREAVIANNKVHFPWHQLKLIFNYPIKEVYEMLSAAKDKKVIIFKKSKDAEAFLKNPN